MASADVIAFPTERKAAYPNPAAAGWWKNPLPPNVRPMWKPRGAWTPPQPEPMPATAYLVLAVVEALRTPRSTWHRTGGPDVWGKLAGLLDRFEEDPEVSARVKEACRMLQGRRSGRC